MLRSLFFWLFSVCPVTQSSQIEKVAKISDSYIVENIALPEGLTGETGALEFLPNGNLIAGFHRGEIMIYNPKTKEWRVFATGLHDPLGILVISNSEILVMQLPELTRVKDTDGDGKADLFEKVTDDFGITGNYHEFNYGPVKDKKGNLFIGLNCASPNGKVQAEVRGKLDTTSRGPKQMFSAVPYRGWIMKLTPDGKLHPYASGLRSPNGLGFDQNGHLLVAENQGDWVGTSALYDIKEGKFYGHPSGLIWEKDWKGGNPTQMAVADLDKMRTKAAVLFPHGIMANSPSQPLADAGKGKFGPFSGQVFIGEMNQERILRVMLEEVDGELQGACTPFLDGNGLHKGNNRLAFAPDGSLWTGQNDHGWAGDRGIQRIVFTGRKPMEIYSMSLTKTGFELTFTKPLDAMQATKISNYQFRHYYYEYHKKYGSDQFDVQSVPITSIKVSPDHKKVTLTLATLKPGYIYELNLSNMRSSSGEELANKLICYTLNRIRK